MKQVKEDSTVKIDYTGKFKDGEVFDTSIHGDHSHPIEVKMGAKQVIPGFEKALLGMKEGEEKDVVITPEEGYGQHNKDLLKKFPKKDIPESEKLKAGMTLGIQTPDGQQMPVVVKEVLDEEVVIDLNHPLAGKELHFHLKVVSVE